MMTKPDAYQAASQSAVYFQQLQAGVLRVAGRDRVDFMQRQTTNDLRQLTPQRTVDAVLTSPTAKILDVFCVVDQGESLHVITLPGRFDDTLKFLRSRIFFSDQVSVDDLSEQYAQILLFGPQLDHVLEKLDMPPLEKDQLFQLEIADQSITVISQKILMDVGYRFLVPVESTAFVTDALDQADCILLDGETFEILRVEAGQPGPVGELVDAYTPLEVRLNDMISDSKGCYTGQEIIARQITYDKVTKNLAGIKLDGLVNTGSEIQVDGKTAGTLTSVVNSARLGPIGLGVVRRRYNQTGTSVTIPGQDGSVVCGEVVDLPFR